MGRFTDADRVRIKAAVVNAAWDGCALYGTQGVPTKRTIWKWARQDPLFRQALAQGRAQGRSLKRELRAGGQRLSEAEADAFVAALRDGATYVAAGRRPGLPSLRRVRAWRAQRPDFEAAVRAALAAGAAVRRRRPTRWATYDEAVADRIILRLHRGEPLAAVLQAPDLPGRTALDRWRRQRPDFAGALRLAQRAGRIVRGRANTIWSPALEAAILDAVRRGYSLNTLVALPGMPCRYTLHNWSRTRAGFAAAVRAAYADRAAMHDDLALERLWGATRAEQRAHLATEGIVLERASTLRSWPEA